MLAVVAVVVVSHRSNATVAGGTVTTVLDGAKHPTSTPSGRSTTIKAGSTTRPGSITTRASSTSVAGPNPTGASGGTAPKGIATVVLSSLPAEARHTYELVAKGGPYPYPRDGVVFENRERVLPSQSSGYYHEYTVVTPGSFDRGARRMITGKAGERFYTDDHYATFRFVVPG